MKFEKKYAKVMKEKEEIALDQLRFLFSAIDFIVSMGKLAEFQKWQADKAMDAAFGTIKCPHLNPEVL